jgi:hypothetical protein
MKRILLSAVVALVSASPMGAFAQDENVNCAQYLEMDTAAQLAAINAALALSEAHGMGRRFEEDATDEEKLDYMQASCTEPDGTVMVDLVDMLGT